MRKNKLILFALLFLLGCCADSFACDGFSANDSYTVLAKLLNLNSTNKLDRTSQLKAYREWSDVYLKSKKIAEETKDISCVKIYLFSIFVAYTTGSAETTENIGLTFLPFFQKHPDNILRILKEHAFLSNSTCKALTGYFELMDAGKKKERKEKIYQ